MRYARMSSVRSSENSNAMPRHMSEAIGTRLSVGHGLAFVPQFLTDALLKAREYPDRLASDRRVHPRLTSHPSPINEPYPKTHIFMKSARWELTSADDAP